MAKGFNLTAQINLRGPANLKPVIAQIRKELGTVSADVKLNIDSRSIKSVDAITSKLRTMNSVLVQSKQNIDSLNASFRTLSSALSATQSDTNKAVGSISKTAESASVAAKTVQQAGTAMEEFGRQSFLAIKRFAAFSFVTSGIFALTNAITGGFRAFINFDKELIKLQQVTGKGASGIAALEKEITRLATTMGVSSESLINVASTLAQAGLSANETRIALEALAKTELAPSFDNLTDTTEGAIAAMRQFGLEAGQLESALGSINAVAAAFAVESKDIISAIQRTGGVFATASKGVSQGTDALNEFVAIFTSVRQTTRESAETIATGLRTIFTRIQRASTIQQLKEFGVVLTDLEGKFVGPFEAIKRLSEGLSKLDPRDLRFSQIVEELGGFRQIGKVIPLIQQFATAQEALKVAQKGQGSLTEAQVVAQQSLANQLAKVREQFLALIRDVGKSTVFQGLFKVVTGLASAMISLAGAFKPILPILAVMGAIKGVSAITQFATGFFGGMGKGGGARSVGQNAGETISGAKEKEKAEATNRASQAITENTGAIRTLTTAINSLTTRVDANTSAINSRGASTLSGGGKVLGFNKGGLVPGYGGGDRVPALLEGGEVVINKRAVKKYGAGNLVKMNRGGTIARFADGSMGGIDLQNQSEFTEIAQPNGVLQASHVTELIPLNAAQIRRAMLDTKNKKLAFSILNLGLGRQTANKETAVEDVRTLINQISDTDISKIAQDIGLEAQRDIKINLPGSWNQSLRRGDPRLVSKTDMVDWISKNSSVTKPLPKTIKPLVTKEWIASKINNITPRNPQTKTFGQWAYDEDSELTQLGEDINEIYRAEAISSSLMIKFRGASKAFYQSLGGYGSGTGGRGDRANVSSDILRGEDKSIGGIISKFAEGGTIQDIADKKGMSLQEAMLQQIQELGGIKRIKSLMDQRLGDRTYNSILKADNIKAGKNIPQVQSVLDAVLSKLKSEGILAAQAVDQATKVGVVGLQPFDYVDTDGPLELGGKSVFMSIRGLSSKFADRVAKMRESIENVVKDFATGIQQTEIFDGGEQLRLDFDETLVSGADIFNNAGKIDIPGYSDLERVKESLSKGKLTQLGEKLREILSLDPSFMNRISVLTARPQSNAKLLSERLNQLGLSIPESKITGTSGGGKAKADALGTAEKLIDDNLDNIRAAKSQGKSALQYSEIRKLSDTEKAAAGFANIEGAVLESTLAALGARGGSIQNRAIDYENGLGPAAQYFPGIGPDWPTEVKRTLDSTSIGRAKEEFSRFYSQKFSAGGVAKIKSLKFSKIRDIERFLDVMFANGIQKKRLSGQRITSSDSWNFQHPLIGSVSLTGQETDDLYSYLELQKESLLKKKGFKSDPIIEEAILGYKTSSADINFGLSEKKLTKDQKKQINTLKKAATDKLPKMLYSGIGSNRTSIIEKQVGENFLQASGKNFSLPGFLSTSSDIGVAKSFGNGLLLKISTNSARKGIAADKRVSSSDHINEYEYEKEFILPPNSSFRINRFAKNSLDVAQLNKGGEVNFVSGGKASRKVPYERGVGPSPFVTAKVKKLGPEIYDLEKDSGLSKFEFNDVVDFARTNDFNFEEFKKYLQERIAQKKAKFNLMMNPIDVLRAMTPDSSYVSQKQKDLARSLMGETDAKYNSKYDNARKGFASGGAIPARVSNGEAFVAPKLAKKIGYGKLNKLNQADRNGMSFSGGGISIFKGPGSGTSDSISTSLPVGGYVIRQKATKALGLYKNGGSIGIARFAGGGINLGKRGELILQAKEKRDSKNTELSDLKKKLENATGSEATVIRSQIQDVEKSLTKLEIIITKAGAEFDDLSNIIEKSTNVQEKIQGKLQNAEDDLVQELKKYKFGGKQFNKLNASQKKTVIDRAKRGEYKEAGKDRFEAQNKAIKKAETRLKTVKTIRERAQQDRQLKFGDLQTQNQITERTQTKAEKQQQRYADDEFLKYKAYQEGTDVEGYKYQLGSQLNKRAYETKTYYGSQVQSAKSSLASKRDSLMGIGTTIKSLEGADKNDAAVQTRLADAQSRLSIETENLAKQMLEINPTMKDVGDKAKKVADALASGDLAAAQAAMEEALGTSIDSAKAMDIAMQRFGKEMNIDPEFLKRQFGEGGAGSLQKIIYSLGGPFKATTRALGLLGAASEALRNSFADSANQLSSQTKANFAFFENLGKGAAMAGELDIAKNVTSLGNNLKNLGGKFEVFGNVLTKNARAIQTGATVFTALSFAVSKAYEAYNQNELENSLKRLSAASSNTELAFKNLGKNQSVANVNAARRSMRDEAAVSGDLEARSMIYLRDNDRSNARKYASYDPTGVTSSVMGLPQEAEARKEFLQFKDRQTGQARQLGEIRLRSVNTTDTEQTMKEANEFNDRINQLEAQRARLVAEGADRTKVAAKEAEIRNEVEAKNEKLFRKSQTFATIRETTGATEDQALAQMFSEQGATTEDKERRFKLVTRATGTKEEQDKAIAAAKALAASEAENERISLALANAYKKVSVETENLIRVYDRASAMLMKFSQDIERIKTSASQTADAYMGRASIGPIDRTNERILGNMDAYSLDEVRKAASDTGGLVGGGIGGENLQNQIVAGKLIQQELPNILANTTGAEGADGAMTKLQEIFDNVGVELPKVVADELRTSLDKQLEGSRENASFDELMKSSDILAEVNKQTAAAIKVAQEFQKQYNDALQTSIELTNEYGKALAESTEWTLKASDIRARADIELAQALGKTLSLSEQNRPQEARIEGLTSGVIAGGSMDPEAIYGAMKAQIEDRDNNQSKILEQRKNALAADPGNPAAKAALAQQLDNMAKQNNSINNARKALEELANDGAAAANALKGLQEQQKMAAGSVNFLEKVLTSDSAELYKMNQGLAAYTKLVSGKATKQDVNSLQFRQQAFGGLKELQGLMPDSVFNQMQAKMSEAMIDAMPGGSKMLDQKTGALFTGADGKTQEMTFRDAIRLRAEGKDPIQQQFIDAYNTATQRQATAADMLAQASTDVATTFKEAQEKALDTLAKELPNMLKRILTDGMTGEQQQAYENYDQATKSQQQMDRTQAEKLGLKPEQFDAASTAYSNIEKAKKEQEILRQDAAKRAGIKIEDFNEDRGGEAYQNFITSDAYKQSQNRISAANESFDKIATDNKVEPSNLRNQITEYRDSDAYRQSQSRVQETKDAYLKSRQPKETDKDKRTDVRPETADMTSTPSAATSEAKGEEGKKTEDANAETAYKVQAAIIATAVAASVLQAVLQGFKTAGGTAAGSAGGAAAGAAGGAAAGAAGGAAAGAAGGAAAGKRSWWQWATGKKPIVAEDVDTTGAKPPDVETPSKLPKGAKSRMPKVPKGKGIVGLLALLGLTAAATTAVTSSIGDDSSDAAAGGGIPADSKTIAILEQILQTLNKCCDCENRQASESSEELNNILTPQESTKALAKIAEANPISNNISEDTKIKSIENKIAEPQAQIKEQRSAALDWLQFGVGLVGLVPVIGELADVANAGIYAARAASSSDSNVRNDLAVDAGLSAASAIPFAGWAANAAKAGKGALKYVPQAAGITTSVVQSAAANAVAEEVRDNVVREDARSSTVPTDQTIQPKTLQSKPDSSDSAIKLIERQQNPKNNEQHVYGALNSLENMAKEATSPGSIYTHDTHVEKVLYDILSVLSGKKVEVTQTAPAEINPVQQQSPLTEAQTQAASSSSVLTPANIEPETGLGTASVTPAQIAETQQATTPKPQVRNIEDLSEKELKDKIKELRSQGKKGRDSSEYSQAIHTLQTKVNERKQLNLTDNKRRALGAALPGYRKMVKAGTMTKEELDAKQEAYNNMKSSQKTESYTSITKKPLNAKQQAYLDAKKQRREAYLSRFRPEVRERMMTKSEKTERDSQIAQAEEAKKQAEIKAKEQQASSPPAVPGSAAGGVPPAPAAMPGVSSTGPVASSLPPDKVAQINNESCECKLLQEILNQFNKAAVGTAAPTPGPFITNSSTPTPAVRPQNLAPVSSNPTTASAPAPSATAQTLTIDSSSLKSLNEFNTKFNDYVSRLEKLEFKPIEHKVEISVQPIQVQITGAAAMEGLSKEMQRVAEAMIVPRIQALRDEISKNSNGQLIKPTAAIGGGSKSTGDIPQ